MPIDMENVERVFGKVDLTKTVIAEGEEGRVKTITLVTDRFIEMAKTILTNVPNCADRSAALRDLRVAKMTCIDAIAKGGLV